MDRRDFFRRSAVLAAGVVAADQLELVERLGWKRRFFAGWSEPGKPTIVSFATEGGVTNWLDDYEQGTFTPRGSLTPLHYTRVGNLVQVHGIATLRVAENVPRLMGLPCQGAPRIIQAA